MELFRKLKVWRAGHEVVIAVYKMTEVYPSSELYSLVSQMRRAAVSVAANIAESTKRVTNKDKHHFLVMADASNEELKYYVILSYTLGYIEKELGKEITENCRTVGRMLTGLKNKLKSDI